MIRRSLSESDFEVYLKLASPSNSYLIPKNQNVYERPTKLSPEIFNTSYIPATFSKNISTNDLKYENDVNTNFDLTLKDLYKRHLLKQQNIIFGEILGEGHFGYVQCATYKINNSTNTKIAIKKLLNKGEKKAVLKEIQILSTCKHKNVVSFLGFIEQDGHLCIVTEFMGGGDLSTYLKNPEMSLTVENVISYIFQVVEGMTYLHHKKILHRDLAARNCLLNKTYDILKITDFGLSKEMNANYQYVCHTNSELPFQILPLEDLLPCLDKYRTITFQGDIWAFGILMWEMFERGGKLYNEMNHIQLRAFLDSGKRLFRPRQCPMQLYNLMQQCWDRNPKNRPKFDLIKLNIKNIYDEIKESEFNCLNTQIEMSNSSVYACANDIKPYPAYTGTYIFIKSSNEKLISGENDLRLLKCDKNDANHSEKFIVENFGNGVVALKSKHSYVSSENGERRVTCNRKIITETEKFKWIDNPDDTFSLKGNNNKFLSRDNREGLMTCDSDVNGNFQKFTYIDYYNMPFDVADNNDLVAGKGFTVSPVMREDFGDVKKIDLIFRNEDIHKICFFRFKMIFEPYQKIKNSWNIEDGPNANEYLLPDWANLEPGETYKSSGFVANGPLPKTIALEHRYELEAGKGFSVSAVMTENFGNFKKYQLNFLNKDTQKICFFRFKMVLKSNQKIDDTWNINDGPNANEYILPASVSLAPGETYDRSGLVVNGPSPKVAYLEHRYC